MLLSLIIPTHRRCFQAEKLLQSIAFQDFPKEQVEILLISNFKDALLRARVPVWEKTFINFKYKEVGFKGVNKARNMGIRFARGEILYFLDDDCVLPNRDHLKKTVQAHKEYPELAGIGGPYITEENLKGIEEFYHKNSELWLDSSISEDKPIRSQLLGGNASYKSFVFDKGYYFEPSIVFGGSEVSFNESIKKYGLLRDNSLGVYHYPQLKGLAFIKKSFKQGVGAFKNESQEEKESFHSKWAFFHGDNRSFYSFLYQFFFKIGYFWEASSSSQKVSLFFKPIRFLFFIFKSRWYFFKKWFRWFYGTVWSRFLGVLWYCVGWFYGKVLSRFLGVLWYCVGWFYGKVLLHFLYGKVLSRFLGMLWYFVGWFYGKVILFLFYHSPPMKLYYFSEYQYQKRIKPFFTKKNNR